MSKRHDNSYFIEENSQNFKKQYTIRLFLNTSQEPMVGPVVDDEAVTLPTQMGPVHDPPNLSLPQNFDSPDGFMEDDGFNGPYKKDGPDSKGRSFQGSWRKEFPWLYYDKTKDRSFCRWCKWGLQKEKLLPEFLRLRYTYEKQRLIGVGWKDYRKGREDLRKHENSEIHKHALEVYIIAATSDSMSKLIDFKGQQQHLKKRAALDTIFARLKWFGQRGLAIRRHEHDEGNFKSLMEFVSNYYPNLKEHVESEIRTKHMGWEIQNEILKMLSDGATRTLIKQVQDAKQFAIIIDEVCDKGWVEQLSICLRWVDKEYEVQVKWMTFIALDKSDAEMIYTMVKQCLLAYGLTFENCRGQACDGASVMRGRKNGVSTRILRDYPLAIYSYCSGHGLSLICQDAVSSHPDLKKTQEYIRGILAFIQYSPRRRIEFKALVVDQGEEEILLAEEEGRPAVPQPKGNLRPLCVTRWVLRAPVMNAFCANYSKILDYMMEIQDGALNGTSSKNKDIAVGYVKTLHKFKIYFRARLLQRLYNIVGPVNAEIQGRKCSVGGVRDKIMDLMGVMAAMGSDEQGLAFYEEVKSQAMDIRLEQPMVSRTQHLARCVVRGVHSELEIEQGAIDKFHAKIYATIFEATADGIAQRCGIQILKKDLL